MFTHYSFRIFCRIRTSAKLQSVDPVLPGMDFAAFKESFHKNQLPPCERLSNNSVPLCSSKLSPSDPDSKSLNSVDSGIGVAENGDEKTQAQQRLSFVDKKYCDNNDCDTRPPYTG